MTKRIITVVLEIEDQSQASAIWDAHMKHTTVLGSHVLAIGNGNAFKERDKLESKLGVLEEHLIGSEFEKFIDGADVVGDD